ncbi:MAG: hypothetical protein KBS60_05170 [Phascolarctobacterium sp.]|nr:hypothetical protein [Candidatus Phascolarctobacterium caballi]
MSEYAVETRSTTPKNFFAGEFPIVPETGTAGAAVPEYAPVTTNESGNIVPITKGSGSSADAAAKIIGISAAAAGNGEPVTYYMTGEFFADAINVPEGIELADVKAACRKISIFLK